jgi:menaquinone-dependent protoporphyrinogen IX oxidase
VAVFALGPKTTQPEDIADARRQLDHALQRFPEVEPVSIAVFGGVIDPAQLHFPFSHLPASDARDWREIRRWADDLATIFGISTALAS